jgi:hypothetical protein
MRLTILSAVVALLVFTGCSEPKPTIKDVPHLGVTVARAMGLGYWRNLGRLAFTWTHAPSGTVRSYEWHPRKGTVVARFGAAAEGRTAQTLRLNEPVPADQAEYHRAWVNDSYWLALPLMMLDDGSEIAELGELEVPGFPALGKPRALEVRYAEDEGYTGGDRYVLYVGQDDLPVAWAFHRGGAEEPTVVTTRGRRRRANGISLPTLFETADGKTFIEITELTAEPASG